MKNIKEVSKYIDLLFKSRSKTPQHQKELVVDIAKRGFLKQVIDITVFSALANTCCSIPLQYSNVSLPDMGDSDRANLSPSDANFLGQQIIQDIYNQGGMENDYDVLDYLNDIGNNLVSFSPMAGDTFSFYMVKEKTINAFALPGGYICFNNGLIYTTQSEAEFTSVMSHEIGHVVQHHIFRNISVYNRSQWMSLAGLIAGVVMATINPGLAMVALSGGQGIGIQNMLNNSRDFEREADRVGQNLMYEAGYDPSAMPEFFKRMQSNNQFNNNEALAFLQTHPVTSERISEAQTRARQMHVKMRPDSTSFLLIREKCRKYQLGTIDAIKFYNDSLREKKYTHIDAQYFGLANTLNIFKKYKEANNEINKISQKEFITHPAVLNLKALISFNLGDIKKALNIYDQALESYPNYKALFLGRSDLFMHVKDYREASKQLDNLSNIYINDSDIWNRIATINSDLALNNKQKYHYALGNVQFIKHDYKAALNQYQKALAAKSDDNVLSNRISAKIFDTKEIMKNNQKYGGA